MGVQLIIAIYGFSKDINECKIVASKIIKELISIV